MAQVPQNAGDPLASQRWRRPASRGDVLREDVSEAGTRQWLTVGADEQRWTWGWPPHVEPGAQRLSGLLPEWQNSFTTAFAEDVDGWLALQHNVTNGESDKLGDAQPRG
jgi:hypothetical protein